MKTQDEGHPCAARMRSAAKTASWLAGATLLVSSLALPATQAYAMSPDMLFHARPVSDGVLNQMRGGFNIQGMHFSIGVDFQGIVNGVAFVMPTLTLDTTTSGGNTGVINHVGVTQNGTMTITQDLTSTINGLLTTIQNSQNGANIQTTSKLTLDIFNSGINIQSITNSVHTIRFNQMLRFQSILGNLH